MAVTTSGWLLNSFLSTYRHVTCLNYCPIGFVQVRNYAARKGTREKARKKKVKVVVEKVGFIPHNQRTKKFNAKKKINIEKIIPDDSKRPDPIDNVWFERFHKWKIFPFEEAVQNYRETNHPTMYNLPTALIKAHIELNMEGTKKTKFIDAFSQITCIPHPFSHGQDRNILAFCSTSEMQNIAMEAGAQYAGGKDLIKKIQNGEFSIKDYEIIVSEPTILPNLLLIRGLMRKKFPSTKLGTLNPDIKMLVTKFLSGIKYSAQPNAIIQSYGTVEVEFGMLNMDTKQLEENFVAIINDVEAVKPRRPFITRTRIMCPPSKEMFKVEFEKYLSKNNISKREVKPEEIKAAAEEEEENRQDAVIASH